MGRPRVLMDIEMVRSLMYLESRARWLCKDFGRPARLLPSDVGGDLFGQLQLLEGAVGHLDRIRVNIDAKVSTLVPGEVSPQVRRDWQVLARLG